MDSFVLLAYVSLAASRTLLQQLLACLNFTLESEDLCFWYEQKKIISINYGCSTSSWKPWRWVRFDMILFMRDIYISSNLNHLQNSLAAAEHWVKDPNKHKNSHKQCDERGISCCEYDGKSMETVTTKCSEFPNGGKAVVEQILASEEINKSKTAELWELQSGILKMTSQVWQSQKRIHINTNHSYHQPP